MFNSQAKNDLAAVQQVLEHFEGGIYKRIDENRELVELLKANSPELLQHHPYVVGWLQSQDQFLVAIEQAVAVNSPFFKATDAFPRQWPVIVKSEHKDIDDNL